MAETNDPKMQHRMLQFMTTEHFVLQTARSATIQEANQRANLFLTSVSSAMIAIAFIAQATQMGRPFVLFTAILLACLYYMGVVTFVRAVQVSIEDMVHARGMARIRHYYAEAAPPMRRYLVHSIHDDELALRVDKAFKSSRWQSLATTAGMLCAVDAVIAGAFSGIVVKAVFDPALGWAVAVGVGAFAASLLVMQRYHDRSWASATRKLRVLFPGGDDPTMP